MKETEFVEFVKDLLHLLPSVWAQKVFGDISRYLREVKGH